MEEIIFIVKESDEGGYEASALGESIITEAEDVAELKSKIKEAIQCHFDEQKSRIIRLHFVREEVFAV